MSGTIPDQPQVGQDRTWNQVVSNHVPPQIVNDQISENNTPMKRIENTTLKKNQHVLHGTANKSIQSTFFSADVDLVAFNVGKSTTSNDLCNWLSQRGLLVKECKLLTTANEARSLTFKVTVDPKDYVRATSDPSLWPYRVGVRTFKNYGNRNRNYRKEDKRQNDFQRNGPNRENNSFFGGEINSRRYC